MTDARDLALEAAGVTICELEHRYVAMRLLLRAALGQLARLTKELRRAQRFHAMDRDQIRQLMHLDERRR